MAKQLIISQEAISDLSEIWDYIARDNQRAADRFIDALYAKCQEILELESIGRSREELFEGLRSLPYRKYVIFFLRNHGDVEIVRILHGARDIESQFE
ncbi:MAG: type II toxin-antitoxin system RelE/ParE family toxin [Opitutales bacterium]|nr:type II toxin-antitoxin system RelE/ParE family toxin [Opitutales bacterium]